MYKAPSASKQLALLAEAVRRSHKALDRDTRRGINLCFYALLDQSYIQVHEEPITFRFGALDVNEENYSIDEKLASLKEQLTNICPKNLAFQGMFLEKIKKYADFYYPYKILYEKLQNNNSNLKYVFTNYTPPCISCFLTSKRSYHFDFQAYIEKNSVGFVINIESTSISSFLGQLGKIYMTDFVDFFAFSDFYKNLAVKTPLILIFHSFDKKSIEFIPLLRSLILHSKLGNIFMLFIFVCNLLRPLDELIGNEIASQLDVNICSEMNSFMILEHFLFNLFSKYRKIRFSKILISKLLTHFILYENDFNGFFSKLMASLDLFSLETDLNDYEKIVTNEDKQIEKIYENFGHSLNLLAIAFEFLSKEQKHFLFNIALWANKTRNDGEFDVISSESSLNNPIDEIRKLISIATRNEKQSLLINWKKYFETFNIDNSGILSNINYALEQNNGKKFHLLFLLIFRQNKVFDPSSLKDSKVLKGFPYIIKKIEQFINSISIIEEYNSSNLKIIDFNGSITNNLFPLSSELDKPSNYFCDTSIPNELSIAYDTLKAIHCTQHQKKNKEGKDTIDVEEWNKAFNESCQGKNVNEQLFIQSMNDLKFIGVLSSKNVFNKMWEPIELKYNKEKDFSSTSLLNSSLQQEKRRKKKRRML